MHHNINTPAYNHVTRYVTKLNYRNVYYKKNRIVKNLFSFLGSKVWAIIPIEIKVNLINTVGLHSYIMLKSKLKNIMLKSTVSFGIKALYNFLH